MHKSLLIFIYVRLMNSLYKGTLQYERRVLKSWIIRKVLFLLRDKNKSLLKYQSRFYFIFLFTRNTLMLVFPCSSDIQTNLYTTCQLCGDGFNKTIT